MKLKAMVIGLGPEYNYDLKDHNIWLKENTKYASNHGASLISRTLIEFFNADFIDDLSKVKKYKKEYDLCIIAFATHVTDWRDVSKYTNFVKELQIKTVAFSLGIQDYSGSSSSVNNVHPSLKMLLEYVLNSSGYCGVRGPNTASVLIKSGFNPEQIIPLGCPTLYRPLNRDLKITKKDTFSNPLIVFHRTISELNTNLISSATLLGQDFLDEVIFNDSVEENHVLKIHELKHYKNHKNGDYTLSQINKNGDFVRTFDEWFRKVGEHDFVFGPRLHGCVAALIQGIPAVMLARDQRVEEIAEFYKIPYIKYEDVGEMTIQEVFEKADYTEFNALYASRFDNFMKLMDDLKVIDHLSFSKDIPNNYKFTNTDLNANTKIVYRDLAKLALRVNALEEQSKKIDILDSKINLLISKMKKLPGFKFLNKLFS